MLCTKMNIVYVMKNHENYNCAVVENDTWAKGCRKGHVHTYCRRKHNEIVP